MHTDKKKRLLIVSTEFPPGPGGIGSHAFQVATQLQRRGWQVHVAAPQNYVCSAVRTEFNRKLTFSLTTIEAGGWRLIQPAQRLLTMASAWRQAQPDAVVATGSRALWLVNPFARLTRTPWLAIGHGSEVLLPSRLGRRLTCRAIQAADAVVAVSAYTSELIRQPHVQPRRLEIIPNGADGDRFRPEMDTLLLRRQLGLNDNRVLMTVGNVTERKAQDIVIRALPAVLKQCPDVVYLIVGLPTRRTKLEGLAAQLGVADAVRFAGMVAERELPLYYNLCDLFVLVSRRAVDGDVEGFGIVVLEAAMCGKPAVVSRGSGLTEAMREGETGLAVAPESVEETASAVLRLLRDDALRHQMGQRARQLAIEATWEQRAIRYDQILSDLVRK